MMIFYSFSGELLLWRDNLPHVHGCYSVVLSTLWLKVPGAGSYLDKQQIYREGEQVL